MALSEHILSFMAVILIRHTVECQLDRRQHFTSNLKWLVGEVINAKHFASKKLHCIVTLPDFINPCFHYRGLVFEEHWALVWCEVLHCKMRTEIALTSYLRRVVLEG